MPTFGRTCDATPKLAPPPATVALLLHIVAATGLAALGGCRGPLVMPSAIQDGTVP